jgi:hypothetical protein
VDDNAMRSPPVGGASMGSLYRLRESYKTFLCAECCKAIEGLADVCEEIVEQFK